MNGEGVKDRMSEESVMSPLNTNAARSRGWERLEKGDRARRSNGGKGDEKGQK